MHVYNEVYVCCLNCNGLFCLRNSVTANGACYVNFFSLTCSIKLNLQKHLYNNNGFLFLQIKAGTLILNFNFGIHLLLTFNLSWLRNFFPNICMMI